jgi:hypothetical protein
MSKKKKKFINFLQQVPICNQNINELNFFSLLYLVYNQIYFNLLVDYCQFGYITQIYIFIVIIIIIIIIENPY